MSRSNYRADGSMKYVPKNDRNMKYVPKTQNPPKKEDKPITNSNLSSSFRSPKPQIVNRPSSSASSSAAFSSSSSSSSASASSSRVEIGDRNAKVNSISSGKKSGKFVNYLPQDEAVAAGFGVEDGALDPAESQRSVDLLNKELSQLLKLNARDFWKEVVSDTSLHDFLDSFLQFRSRWYDFSHYRVKGLVAGVIVGELELSRRVFMVFYRISSNRDPGARASDSLSAKEHGALLQEKKLLDFSKLLDICAIYGHENEELTRILVMNAMKAQPWLHENLSLVTSHFLGLLKTMHERCESSVEAIISSAGNGDHGENRLHVDFVEVMEFINDAVASLDAFVNAYKPAAIYFSCPVETRYAGGDLLSTLARLHDVLLPLLQQGFFHTLGGSAVDTLTNVNTCLRILSMRIIDFAWKLIDICFLSTEVFEGTLPFLNAAKMFPANVEDPVIRGDILVHTFNEIYEKASLDLKGNRSSRSLLRNIEKNYKILSRLDELLGSGWIFMENDQYQHLTLIVMPPGEAMTIEGSNKIQMDEDAAITESKIIQIKDIFPEYGKGFLAACLEAYNQNPEEVIQRILEGTLHEELQRMNISLDTVPPPKSLFPSRNDKGKGTLIEGTQSTSTKVAATVVERQTEGTSSSSLVGRFTRKVKDDTPKMKKTFELKSSEDNAKTAMLASKYEDEYEDEYDDSFDDLGLSVAESGFDDTDNFGDRRTQASGKSTVAETESSSGSRWASKSKKPQFFVKDGRNYSYQVAGSVAVMDVREAALVNRSQKELIGGLGRGGNLPLGAVKILAESKGGQQEQEEEEEEEEGSGEGFGRGRGRGRGRGGGGRSWGRGRGGGGRNYRKDRAMKKHFGGLSGF